MRRRTHRWCFMGVWGGLVLGLGAASGGAHAEAISIAPNSLGERARAIVLDLLEGDDEQPIRVESQQATWRVQGDVYTVVAHAFDTLRAVLSDRAAWCEILPLHFNVKSCTYAPEGEPPGITLYVGRKHYQPTHRTQRLDLSFVVGRSDPGGLVLVLSADQGPMGTHDYALRLAAHPVAPDRSFVHFSFAHAFGVVSKVAMYGYLRTLGRGKVGFSRVDGALVGGGQGIVERNAMRYQLAIQAHLETLDVAATERFSRRLERWFALTARYPEQLHEMALDEYLASKQSERTDQTQLQQERLASVR